MIFFDFTHSNSSETNTRCVHNMSVPQESNPKVVELFQILRNHCVRNGTLYVAVFGYGECFHEVPMKFRTPEMLLSLVVCHVFRNLADVKHKKVLSALWNKCEKSDGQSRWLSSERTEDTLPSIVEGGIMILSVGACDVSEAIEEEEEEDEEEEEEDE